MNKGKTISIVLNIILGIALILSIIYILYFNKPSSNEKNNQNTITICNKTIQDESNLKTYLEETITADENKSIIDDKSKVIYEINNDETYNTLKSDLTNCNDTYSTDKQITCDLEMNEDTKTKIGTWSYKYIENEKTDGFSCNIEN